MLNKWRKFILVMVPTSKNEPNQMKIHVSNAVYDWEPVRSSQNKKLVQNTANAVFLFTFHSQLIYILFTFCFVFKVFHFLNLLVLIQLDMDAFQWNKSEFPLGTIFFAILKNESKCDLLQLSNCAEKAIGPSQFSVSTTEYLQMSSLWAKCSQIVLSRVHSSWRFHALRTKSHGKICREEIEIHTIQ